jgi:hypothetical protein
MEKNYTSCNFLYSDVISASVPYFSLSDRIKKNFLNFVYSAYPSCKNFFVHKKSVNKTPPPPFSPSLENDTLNLQPGEWVQVRSIDEISATLDGNLKYKGLYFMSGMEKFCGKKFKVFKKVEIIKLESTGEVKKLRTPSIFLEGVYCNGEGHEGCDRACFHFWKEAWLKRIPELQ